MVFRSFNWFLGNEGEGSMWIEKDDSFPGQGVVAAVGELPAHQYSL